MKEERKTERRKRKRNGNLIFLYSKGRHGRNEAFHPSIHPIIHLVIHPNRTNIYLKKKKN